MLRSLGKVVAFLLLASCLIFPALVVEMINTSLQHDPYVQVWEKIWLLDAKSLAQREKLSKIYDDLAQATSHLIQSVEPAVKEMKDEEGKQLLAGVSEDFSEHQKTYQELQTSMKEARTDLTGKLKAMDANTFTPQQSKKIYALLYVPFVLACGLCGWLARGHTLRTQNAFWHQKRQSYLDMVNETQATLQVERAQLQRKKENLDAEVAERLQSELAHRDNHFQEQQRQLAQSAENVRAERLALQGESAALRNLQVRVEQTRQQAAHDRDYATETLQKAEQKGKDAAEWGRRIEAGVTYLQQKLNLQTEEAQPAEEEIRSALTKALRMTQVMPQQ